jgi:hypothetical protein
MSGVEGGERERRVIADGGGNGDAEPRHIGRRQTRRSEHCDARRRCAMRAGQCALQCRAIAARLCPAANCQHAARQRSSRIDWTLHWQCFCCKLYSICWVTDEW